MEYFQCRKGCAKCCPDGTIDTPLVELTLQDINGLYSLKGATPEKFVNAGIWWKLCGEFGYYLWAPILPTPCPYITKNKECDIYYNNERPIICKIFPEELLTTTPQGVPPFPMECIHKKSLPSERVYRIKKLGEERQNLIIKTASYFNMEVDLRIPQTVEPLIGKIPFITTLYIMLENKEHFSPEVIDVLQESKRTLDEMVIELSKTASL